MVIIGYFTHASSSGWNGTWRGSTLLRLVIYSSGKNGIGQGERQYLWLVNTRPRGQRHGWYKSSTIYEWHRSILTRSRQFLAFHMPLSRLVFERFWLPCLTLSLRVKADFGPHGIKSKHGQTRRLLPFIAAAMESSSMTETGISDSSTAVITPSRLLY